MGRIDEITYFGLDVNGLSQERVFAYIIPNQEDEMILGTPWLKDVNGVYSARKGYLDIHTKSGEKVRCWNRADPSISPVRKLRISKIRAKGLTKMFEGVTEADRGRMQIGKVTMEDIDKALRPKERVDPKTRLPKRY
jgi:hypothetical protein